MRRKNDRTQGASGPMSGRIGHTGDIAAGRLLQVSPEDNVAVAIDGAAAGAAFSGYDGLVVGSDVPRGHKIALTAICEGEDVVKYGFPIGRATRPIAVGEHVHSHNVATRLSGVDEMAFAQSLAPMQVLSGGSFRGYRRVDGRVGIRNEIWIIPTVGCVAGVAERIAAAGAAKRYPHVDDIVAFAHPFGCSQLGDDLSGTRAILAALAAHPNAGGVVFIGLGCESNQLNELLAGAPFLHRKRVRQIIAQDLEDELAAGARAVAELSDLMAADRRTECSASDLVIGVKCGGSDAFSGLTANALVGRMTDRVASGGGSVVITEIPEMFGAEQVLAQRCASQSVFAAFKNVINDFKQYFIDHGEPISENPSPGNIEGGITTLEEKSLGAVQKAGRVAPIVDVIHYGERIGSERGLIVLEAPGNDAISSTALVAAGAQILLFTTGRGTPLGFPAPTIKIASNSALAERKSRWVDFDAGVLLNGMAGGEAADALFEKILAVANGEPTRNELNHERSIAIWKRGVTL